METKVKKKEMPLARAPTHKKYYVTNVRGGSTSQDIRFELLNEKMETKEGVIYIADAQIILNGIGAKRLKHFLDSAIKKFEEENGPIKMDPKKDLWI